MINLPTKYFVNKEGKYLGAFCGVQHETPILSEPKTIEHKDGRIEEIPPEVIGWKPGAIHQPLPEDLDAIEVDGPPEHGNDLWDGVQWVPHVPKKKVLDVELNDRDMFIQTIGEVIGVEKLNSALQTIKARIADKPESEKGE